MMFRSLSAVAALLMMTSFANAAFDAQSVQAQLEADGYTNIEIKVGQTIAKVEAIKGTTKIEVTYDITTGDVIKSETGPVGEDDGNTPGVVGEDSNVGDDDSAGDDDGPNHDLNDDHGDDDQGDDQGDDHGGVSGPGGDDGDAGDDDQGDSGSGDDGSSGGGDDDHEDDNGDSGDDDENDD